MHAAELLSELQTRHVRLSPAPEGLRYEAPRGALTPDLRARLIEHKTALIELLTLDRIQATWKPGEWLAYRDGAALVTAKYAGLSTAGGVNLWLSDGAVRAIPPGVVALDWRPDAAEIFEERLCIMLASGVPEDVARIRAEECTREFLERHACHG